MDPAHTRPKPPDQLGEFRIHDELGHGGSGVVYDASWGPRRVALKVLHAELAGANRSQFLGEAQRLQQIGHPSVVKVLAVGELPDGRPYLAMERLDGETLASAISRGRLSLERSLALFGELCSAVTALHEQGLVHRDLKPENVFVVNDRHAVLLDFGIAKDLAAPASTTTQEGNVRGTPAYMAPERFFGQSAGLATDVYELALVLYAMLAGQLPWHDAGDPEARLSPLPLTDLAPVPEALDVEIRRALSTRAQNRPISAAALYTAVVEASGGEVAEPGPAETARLRPGSVLPEQPTPLAWAPTLAAPSESKAIPKKKWPIVAAASVAVIGGVVAFAYTQRSKSAPVEDAAVSKKLEIPKPDPNDPWAAKPDVPKKELAIVEAVAPIAKSRAAVVNAIAHLPSDTNAVISVQVDELRTNNATADVLKKLANDPKAKLLTSEIPECVMALASGSDWIVFGAPSFDTKGTGEIVVGGRWRREDIEKCAGDANAKLTRSGDKVYQLGDLGWLDFLDDHTAYVALRPTFGAEQVHAMVKKPSGASAATRALLAKLPAERTIAFAINGKTKVDWSSMLLLPTGSDVFGWATITPKGMELDAGADAHSEKAAKAAAGVIRPQLGDMFTTNDGVGKMAVSLDGTEVHVKGFLTTFTLGMLGASLDH